MGVGARTGRAVRVCDIVGPVTLGAGGGGSGTPAVRGQVRGIRPVRTVVPLVERVRGAAWGRGVCGVCWRVFVCGVRGAPIGP